MEKEQWYHGSGTRIEKFDKAFLGLGVEQHGSGFYFTNNLDEAIGYTEYRNIDNDPKPGGESEPCVMHVEFEFDESELLDSKSEETLEFDVARQIIALGLERTEDKECFLMSLENYGELAMYGEDGLIDVAASACDGNELVRGLYNLANDLFGGEEGLFCLIAKEVTGYAGMIASPDEGEEGNTHIIAWDADDVKVIKIRTIADIEADEAAVVSAMKP